MVKHIDGIKDQVQYPYVSLIKYDLYESRTSVRYTENLISEYTYDPLNHRLATFRTTGFQGMNIIDKDYEYDSVGNIVDIEDQCNPNIINSYIIGGPTHMTYAYDDIYRLTSSTGDYNNNSTKHATYTLSMSYDLSGKISEKTQTHVLNSNIVPGTSYSNYYEYGQSQPHAPIVVGDMSIVYDPNGNQMQTQTTGSNVINKFVWDEENRLALICDNSDFHSYLYDNNGERYLKINGSKALLNLNGQDYIEAYLGDDHTLYVNPFLTVTSEEYTKHYYMNNERFATKIGGGFDVDSVGVSSEEWIYGFNIQSIPDYDNKTQAIDNLIDKQFDSIREPCMYSTTNSLRAFIEGELSQNQIESLQYFSVNDHLGGSNYIIDTSGVPREHLEYMPFGELFDEESVWNLNYDFNLRFTGKEIDQETGLYYYGARYYDPKNSVWLGVDPLVDKYPSLSPFTYCANNPIKFIDPDGRSLGWYDDGSGTPQFNPNVHSQRDMKSNGLCGTYLGETGKGVDPATGQAHTQYNANGNQTLVPVTLPTTEVKANDPYPYSRILTGDDKGYGPATSILPKNGSIEAGVSGVGIFGGSLSIGYAWDKNGGNALQLNIGNSGGFETPGAFLQISSYNPNTSSFSVSDLGGTSINTSIGGGPISLSLGSNIDLKRRIKGNYYSSFSLGVSVGIKSVIPASIKQTFTTTSQITWK